MLITDPWLYVVAILAALLFGILLGVWLHHRVSDRTFFAIVYVLLLS